MQFMKNNEISTGYIKKNDQITNENNRSKQ